MLNYDELVRRVPIWLYATNRTIIDEMPTIIEQAEDRLEQVIDHDQFKTVLTGLSVGTDGLLDLTAQSPRVLEVRAVRLRWRDRSDGWTPLNPRDLERLTMLYNDDRPGRPRFYAEYGGPLQLKLFPKPHEAMDVELTANVVPPRLSVGNQTNVYTDEFPRAIEKACLHYGATFMKNYEDAAQYEKDMIAALGEAAAQVGRRRRDETDRRPRETHNMTGA